MYQCAGICYSRRNQMGMACVIRLSEPLLKLRSRKDLVETLLHEMIHAENFIRGIMEENGGHGKNFLSKMHEINRLAGTNISVYHTFIDEVNLYKKHWWRCDGACKNRGPFFGFVKRTCNRAPGKNDKWWQQHEQTCGGTFIKVKEPEKVVKAKKGKENKGKAVVPAPKPSKTSPGTDIRKFFKPSLDDSGSDVFRTPPTVKPSTSKGSVDAPPKKPEFTTGGHTLGGASSGRSRLLDMFDDKRKKAEEITKKRKILKDEDEARGASPKVIVIDDSFSSPNRDHKSFHDNIKSEFEDDDDIIFIDDEFDDNFAMPKVSTIPTVVEPTSDSCHCPCCNVAIEITKINEHLDQCLGM